MGVERGRQVPLGSLQGSKVGTYLRAGGWWAVATELLRTIEEALPEPGSRPFPFSLNLPAAVPMYLLSSPGPKQPSSHFSELGTCKKMARQKPRLFSLFYLIFALAKTHKTTRGLFIPNLIDDYRSWGESSLCFI